MEVRKRLGLRSAALLGIPLMAMLMFAWGQIVTPAVNAAGVGPEMAMTVSGPGVDCNGGECDVDLGGELTLSVDIVTAPIEGYILVQTFVDYGLDLTYIARADVVDEFLWPDVGSEEVIIRGVTGPGEVNHGGITGLIPPLPASDYTGPVLEIDLQCSDTYSRTTIRLLPGRAEAHSEELNRTSGTLFAFEDGPTRVDIPVKTNSVIVNCGDEPAPMPTFLPTTGTFGATGGSETTTGTWVVIAALLVIGATGLSTFGLRAFARNRAQ